MPSVANTLIDSLPRSARNGLLAICEPIELVAGRTVSGADAPTRHVYFPTGSLVSLTTSTRDAPVLEVAMVGNEGMLGTQVTLGIFSVPLHALVRVSGTAWRIAAAPFNRELAGSRALQRSLKRYLHVTILQLTSDARCLHFHPIDQRLARWLLMTQDRTHGNSLQVTHHLIAHLMGVRRVGITTAAGALQRCDIIRYVRGELTIVDRNALESRACSCYATDRKTYARFLSL